MSGQGERTSRNQRYELKGIQHSMAKKQAVDTKRPIESYEHKDKLRMNNPPIGW